MDDLYGRNETLRQNLNMAHIEYYGDVPANTKVYLEKPQVLHPLTQRGEPSKTPQTVGTAYEVRAVRQKKGLKAFTLHFLRANQRGYLEAKFARVSWFGLCRRTTPPGMVIASSGCRSNHLRSQ